MVGRRYEFVNTYSTYRLTCTYIYTLVLSWRYIILLRVGISSFVCTSRCGSGSECGGVLLVLYWLAAIESLGLGDRIGDLVGRVHAEVRGGLFSGEKPCPSDELLGIRVWSRKIIGWLQLNLCVRTSSLSFHLLHSCIHSYVHLNIRTRKLRALICR